MNEQIVLEVQPWNSHIYVYRIDQSGRSFIGSGPTLEEALRTTAGNIGKPLLLPLVVSQ